MLGCAALNPTYVVTSPQNLNDADTPSRFPLLS